MSRPVWRRVSPGRSTEPSVPSSAGLRKRPDPDAGTLGPLVYDSARRLPSHDVGSIFTAARGEGPTVLLSHGVTLTSRVWVKQFAELPELGFRVVAFDHRGHGESLAGDSGHSVSNLGWDVRSVIEGLDLRDVVVVGHSMGGIAVQAFAIEHPDVVRERVLGHRAPLDAGADVSERLASPALRGRTGRRWLRPRRVHGTSRARHHARPLRIRQGSPVEPRRAHAPDARELPAGDHSPGHGRAARARPDPGPPEDRHPDDRRVRDARPDDALHGVAPHRQADPRCAAGDLRRRRAHDHARAHRGVQRHAVGLRIRGEQACGRRPAAA